MTPEPDIVTALMAALVVVTGLVTALVGARVGSAALFIVGAAVVGTGAVGIYRHLPR